jgi:hypothetical protein
MLGLHTPCKPLGSLPENRKISVETSSSSTTNRSNLVGDGRYIAFESLPNLYKLKITLARTSVEYLAYDP